MTIESRPAAVGPEQKAAALSVYSPRPRFTDKQVLVFDLDGTLVDTMGIFAGIASKLMTAAYGMPRAEARQRYMETSGIPFCQQLETLFPGHPSNEAVAAEFEERKVTDTLSMQMAPGEQASLVRLVERGFDVVISSNNYQANVDAFARISGLPLRYALGYRDGFAKGAQHFQYILDRLDAVHNDLLFVGDSLADLQKARASGIDFVGRLGTFTRFDFEREDSAVVTVRGLEELEAMV